VAVDGFHSKAQITLFSAGFNLISFVKVCTRVGINGRAQIISAPYSWSEKSSLLYSTLSCIVYRVMYIFSKLELIFISLSPSPLCLGDQRLQPTERLDGGPCVVLCLLDQARDALEVAVLGVAQQLEQQALARGHNAALARQPGQRHGPLARVAAGHAVLQDVDAVAQPQQIQGGLGDADVGFDADDDHRQRGGRLGGELRDEFRHHHGKRRLVHLGRGGGIGRQQARHLGHGRAQPGGVLGRAVDGHVEDFGRFDHLCTRGDHFGKLPDGGAELLLDVADKQDRVGYPLGRRRHFVVSRSVEAYRKGINRHVQLYSSFGF